MLFLGCEKTYTIANRSRHYQAADNITQLTEKDIQSNELKKFLNNQDTKKYSNIKFPVCYFLIEEEDVRLIFHKKLDVKISDQLFMTISGVKYYKLFIHPDDFASYSFLSSAYRFIDAEETEFFGSPIDGKKTMVMWNKRNSYKRAFIVTSNLDERFNLAEKFARLPAQAYPETPESISIIFKRDPVGKRQKIEGQFITALPSIKN